MASNVETPRYETEVDDNIAQVSQKIRLGDLGRGALALACLLFGYALLVMVLDLSMGGSDAWGPLAIRLAAFAGLLFGAGVLGTRIALRYLTSVNPYYAARRLEATVPGAKNSLINWLDLKDEPLPPVIRRAVGMRAARDVAEADADLVAAPRDLWKLAAATGVFFIGLVILFAIVPRQFGSLFSRAVLPFRTSVLSARTTIAILKPGVGDVVVPANQRVEFLARIEGRVPAANSIGAPALHYRYTTNDIPVRVPLEEDNNGQWGVRLSADQLRTGLFWRLTAGDASTPEAQLSVRAQPFVARFEATYNYRPYRKLSPKTATMPSELIPQPRLLGHRGTDVVLKARANAPIKAGTLEFDLHGVKKTMVAELPASEPQTLVFRFGLEKSGTFRVFFEAADGARNLDRAPYAIDVMEDGAPFVELIEPGKDLVAPANGTVLLGGAALDDFGVAALALQLQLAAKPKPQPLAPQPYVPKKKLQFDNGAYPVVVPYVDILALDQLRTPEGKQIALSAGDEITYWLEATDNYDFGRANVGKSKSYKITIKDGLQPTMQQKKERQDAQEQKEQHDQNQADERDKQNKDKDQQGGKEQSDQGQGGGQAKDGNDPKNGAKDNPAQDKNPKNNDGSGGNAGENKQPSPEEQQEKDLKNQIASTGQKLNDALEKSDANKNNSSDPSKGESGNDNNQGGNKAPNPKQGDDKPGKEDKANADGGAGKSNSSSSESENKEDAKGKKKADKNGGGESSGGAGNNPKGAGEGNPNDATTGKDTKKTAPAKSNGADPNRDGPGQGKDPNGVEKSTDKTGTPDLIGKGPTPEGGKTGPSSDKSAGQSTPGQAKGNGTKEGSDGPAKGKAKRDDAQTKDDGGKTGAPDPAKGGSPNKAEIARDDGAKTSKSPPTKEEIDALKGLLKKGGPDAEAAAKKMAKDGQNLEDPALKKSLEDVFKDAGREDDLKELQGANREVAPAPQKEGEGSDLGKGAAPKPGIPKDEGNEPSPQTGPGGRGLSEELKRITPEEAFARRMGNLQLDNLEELKKRIGPDVLKEAKVSDEEWQRFLENAQKLQDLTRQIRQRDDARILKGGASKIGNRGLRQVQANPNAKQDTTVGGRGVPPPEFRDAQQQFTAKELKAR